MEIHERIRALREDNDKTQKELCDLLQTTQPQYSKYERGIQEIPTRHIKTLALFYGTSTDYILGMTNEKEPYKQPKQNTERSIDIMISKRG